MQKLVAIWMGACCWMASGQLHAQSFKRIYEIDTTTLSSVGNLTVRDLVTFGQGNVALAGAVSGPDSNSWYHQSAYILQVTGQGDVIRFDEYEDNSAFVWQGPAVFGLCWDGLGAFYMATGSNQRQVIMKSTETGNFEWAKAQNHHEFYDIVCGDTVVTFLGQDESVQGLHDFSISQFNSNGAGGFGYMYGTVDFEVPEKLIALPDGGFLMVGSSSANGAIYPMLLRVDGSLELVWSKIFADTVVDRRVFAKGVLPVSDGFLVGGYSTGGAPGALDSLMMMKVDTAGNLLWANTYGNSSWTSSVFVDMEASQAGTIHLAANVKDTGYYSPAILHLAADGQLIETRGFDDLDAETEETFGGIVRDGNSLYAAGEYVRVFPNFTVKRGILLMHMDDTLSVGCDNALSVGAGSFAMVELGGVFAQPYQIVDTFPVRHHNGTVSFSQACYIPVSISDPSGIHAVLTFNNPAASKLNVHLDLPEGEALIQIMDLNGRVMLQRQTNDRLGEVLLDVSGLAEGIYLIRASGEEWATNTERLLILR